MRSIIPCLLLLLCVAVSGRRVRVRPVASEEADQHTQQVEYYAEQPEDEGSVLVSRQDTYGRATGARTSAAPRFKPETARQPPVQTIRNYNKLNDDGSFTFGYEAADGSFKEETRGTDCVVRGKYGYVDPDGNKREFTYVSGNPCDPNAVEPEEEQPSQESGEENIPENIPRRPIKPLRPLPKPSRPATALFQQTYSSSNLEEQSSAEEEEEPQRPVPIPVTPRPVRPLYQPVNDVIQPQILRGNQPKTNIIHATPTTPRQPVRITPRPAIAELPATTYRPQLVQASPTPTPVYTKRPVSPTTPGPLNFDEELKKFQIENNVVSTPRTPSAKPNSNDPIYQSELVFDPSSGQYNTVLYQQLPQTTGDFNLRHRLQPYVATPQQNNFFTPSRPFNIQAERAPQSPVYQQQLFQQQQAALLQQSQQLFAQQQKRKQQQGKTDDRFPTSLLQQEPQQFTSQPKPTPAPQRFNSFSPSPIQSFYYVSPQTAAQSNLASGQIDAFLRGHSLTI
ncbi:uncharacterized protein LOC142326876 [Lycorma delicatula]|uniref:uncharacterized protein LOC142326876 n=1 Tax=Lycorma delicatula TaxID=130591 RepID=UPI003F510B30